MNYPLIIAVFALIALNSCKKDEVAADQTPPPVTVPLDLFKMTVSDTLYDPINVVITHVNGELIAESQYNNYTYFKIVINDQVDPDSYGVDAASPFRIYFSNDGNVSTYSSTNGSVTISSHNLDLQKISGTFYATLSTPGLPFYKTVQGGEFNFTYQ